LLFAMWADIVCINYFSICQRGQGQQHDVACLQPGDPCISFMVDKTRA
jgi:hypothetical protein